ncbi:MAG: S-layer homology domain-containing protein, partial [Oscillospiraceae bacterium]|nr:S-layer homology domain-containing protein [Oscillospiraceae bacterium]
MKKRLLSILLTLCLALTLLPTALAASTNPFTDVASGTYYHDAVIWAKDNGVTGGTSATTFSPNATCTRGQVVTFLWRASGSPEPKSTSNPFADVKSGDYYYKAVLWAVEQGITGGTSATTFSPATTCTSAQVVTFLWRANGSPDAYAADSTYYAKAVSWAAEKGLLNNMGPFSVNAPSPRAAIAT